jgi:hypothetical protein
VTQADQAPWFSEMERLRHFRKHGARLGTPTVEAYDGSARGTIRAGRRFTYRDPEKAEARVGYYDMRRERLTMLTDDESVIVSHFSCPARYVRRLRASDY